MKESFKKLFKKVDNTIKYEPLKELVIEVYKDFKAVDKVSTFLTKDELSLAEIAEQQEIIISNQNEEIKELKEEIKELKEKLDNLSTVEILKENTYEKGETTIYDELKNELIIKMFKHLSLKDLQKIELDYKLTEKV